MWLKRIELSGFKSFADPTRLEFSPGICVVVGPNGCGKSNVVEAICWAMGEQGLRPLRAKCSEDLIFAGARDLTPAQACEVSLVFDNQKGGAPAEFNQYAEIEITRRLNRTGESEYLINRTRCRLKDITEFFLGTGLGKQAYSIIEQGEVDRILQAKPEEIRSMIEEAAGISKYRFRRDEAQRKIQLTRENLVRLRDILAELSRQLNSLSRQAKKAERYHKYREEIKNTDLELFAYRGIILKDQIQKLESELAEKKSRLEEAKTSLNRLELDLEDKGAGLDLVNVELAQEQESNYQMKSGLEKLDAEGKGLARQEELELAGLDKKKQDRLAIENQLQGLEQEILVKTRQKEEAEFELSSLQADLETQSSVLEEKLDENKKQKILLGSLQEELRKSDQELARLLEKEKNLVWQETRLREELEQTQSRLLELEPVISGEHQRSFSFNQNLHQLRKTLSDAEQKLGEKQTEMEKLRELIAEKSGRAQEIKNQYQSVCARFENLKEMLEKLEGVERGVRYIMEKNRATPEKKGIHGLVADILDTQPEFELAVEAILGERIQSVVVDSPEQGLEAISALQNDSAGRGTFIPLSLRQLETVAIPEHIRAAGARPLQDLVQVQSGFEPVANYLLGQSVLVDDLGQAVRLWNENGFKGAFVTRDGAVLDPHGILSGGSKDQAGFLAKKRQLKELEEERHSLQAKLQDAEQELSLFNNQLMERENEMNQLRNRTHHLQLEALDQEKDLQQATDELNQKTQSLEKLKGQSSLLSEQVGRISRDQDDLNRRKTEIISALERLKEESEALGRGMESKELELARLEEDRGKFRAGQAGLRERVLGMEEARARAQKSLEELFAAKQHLIAEIEEGEKNILELRGRRERIEIEKNALSADLELKAKKLEGLARDKSGLEQNRAEAQTQLKETNHQVRQQEEMLNQLSLDFEREKLDLNHQKQLLSEIYQEDLDLVIEAKKGGIDLAGFQPEPRQERVDELRKLIMRMGEVNPTALEEYQEVESRFSFLSNQEADLISALGSLESTIQKVNQEYRKQFKTTFEEVNIIFQDLFPKLFGGGKATLLLADENNLLESGIEIIAQPPGKKFQNLSLLSGGEKSLAAIALIFSLYLNRPSPFCLLDEVDSALDELNVDRFNRLLRDLSAQSQILLVTHNKRTMELADLLYGVTMEKPGVSTVVSVRLEELA